MAAETAVKRFVSRHKIFGGTGAFSPSGFDEYLVSLSINQALRYRGVSFCEFLPSGETEIDAFSARRR